MLESVADSNMRAWAAALSPGNGHLAGGLPRKRPPRPPVAPYAGNGHARWGGCRKPPLHGSVLIDHIRSKLPLHRIRCIAPVLPNKIADEFQSHGRAHVSFRPHCPGCLCERHHGAAQARGHTAGFRRQAPACHRPEHAHLVVRLTCQQKNAMCVKHVHR